MYRVGNVLFDGWRSINLDGFPGFRDIGGWTDTFIWKVSVADVMLPPSDYASLIRASVAPALKLRRSASVWVQVDGGGLWYRYELSRSLRGASFPYTVAANTPRSLDFSFSPWVGDRPSPEPPAVEESDPPVGMHTEHCLRVLARIKRASTLEIASLAGISIPTARNALKGALPGYVRYHSDKTNSPDAYWELRRAGLSLALRSWYLPPGTSFSAYVERRHSREGGRHRRTARLFRYWLEKAYPGVAQVDASWSEIRIPGLRAAPDALAWGYYGGIETLFWLEVETGNGSRGKIKDKTVWRLSQAMEYARQFNNRLVFVVLGLPWVGKVVRQLAPALPEYAGVVVGDWGSPGALPLVRWGGMDWNKRD